MLTKTKKYSNQEYDLKKMGLPLNQCIASQSLAVQLLSLRFQLMQINRTRCDLNFKRHKNVDLF